MKANYILNVISIFLLGVLVSCVQDEDYNIPTLEITEPTLQANTTISLVKRMYVDRFVDFNEANNGGELIIEGYVVSNDESGNLYKVLMIQDAPENPTAAIQLDVDVTSLYSKYKPGRKVFVKLNGLGMDNLNGVLHIGSVIGASVGSISATNYEDYIIRSNEVATLVPKLITADQYKDDYLNMLVQIDHMQLSLPELGSAYANPNDTFTVNRYLKNCEDDSQTIIRNSGFASFKSEEFPTGSGSIVAIFSKYNTDYQLYIRDTPDVMFNGKRCDPPILECSGTSGGSITLFNEDFEGTSLTTLTNKGWLNINVNGGSSKYSLKTFNSNHYMQVAAFNSFENPYEVWLITPSIPVDASTAEQLTFTSNVGFWNGDPLTVYVSTDFTGHAADLKNATWIQTEPQLPHGPTSGYGTTFTNSEPINISCLEGHVYIAFRYLGANNGTTTTVQIDKVKVTGTL
ncbi:DUF5689 domain-containing protein [Flavobacteriaceae bacterium LMO-SS05]